MITGSEMRTENPAGKSTFSRGNPTQVQPPLDQRLIGHVHSEEESWNLLELSHGQQVVQQALVEFGEQVAEALFSVSPSAQK